MTAMAMACRPDLIIFDEPTTALDVTTQIEVLAAIRTSCDQFDTAAIYITHDLAVVAQMADRIMVLRHGETVEEAPTRADAVQPAEGLHEIAVGRARPCSKDESPRRRLAAARRSCRRRLRQRAPVLQDVSIAVPRGRTVAVVGESGSGKSTLARVITGLLPPLKGEVCFDGKALPPALQATARRTCCGASR